MAADCLFCRIAAGEIPSDQVHSDDLVVAFRDIAPRAPTHILILPREHIPSAASLTEEHGPLLGRIFAVIAENVGRWGGQTVDHLHFHLMGGRPFTWPPG